MSRSKWKSPYIDEKLNKTKVKQRGNKLQGSEFLPAKDRNSTITPTYIGETFCVHNGKEFLKLTVSEAMVGHKFGEFVSTRGKFVFKAKKKKSK